MFGIERREDRWHVIIQIGIELPILLPFFLEMFSFYITTNWTLCYIGNKVIKYPVTLQFNFK
jgi:hypothetical protein